MAIRPITVLGPEAATILRQWVWRSKEGVALTLRLVVVVAATIIITIVSGRNGGAFVRFDAISRHCGTSGVDIKWSIGDWNGRIDVKCDVLLRLVVVPEVFLENGQAGHALLGFVLEDIVINDDDLSEIKVDDISIEDRVVDSCRSADDSFFRSDAFARVIFS